MTFGGERNRGLGKDDSDRENDMKSSERGVLETPLPFSASSECSSSSGAITNYHNFDFSSSSPPKRILPLNGFLLKGLVDQVKKKSAKKFTTIPFLGGYEFSNKRLRRRLGRNKSAEEAIDSSYLTPKPSWRNFTYKELIDATDNFNPDNLVGEGGHAKVYRGRLPNGKIVAVKKITKTEKNDEARINDYLRELGIIAHINHPNATKLIGFSAEEGLHLVFLFANHGSLDTVLHGEGKPLDWKTRYKVAVGVAEGLQYLHCECDRRIVHRDITSSNILLTEDDEAQISDFGLAKWLPEKWAYHVVSPIEGTFGYLAPEYFMHGIVHEKTDVFAFGILLLELITGQRAVNSDNQSLAMWAKPYLEKKNEEEIADPRLAGVYDKEEMKCAMYTASLCIHHLPNMRPNMAKVVKFLKDENEQEVGARSLGVEACYLEDYSSTSYLNNINRHMQLIFVRFNPTRFFILD